MNQAGHCHPAIPCAQHAQRKLVSGSSSRSPEQEGDRWAGLLGVTSRLPPAGAVHQHQCGQCLGPGPPAGPAKGHPKVVKTPHSQL